MPQLDDPEAARAVPALTALGRSVAVRSKRWRYIRYFDGTEELYDHEDDPAERTNVAGAEEHAAIRRELGEWVPAEWARAVTR